MTSTIDSAMWSSLHKDILAIILGRLDLVDHIRFSSVCKSWKSTADDDPAINKPFTLVRTEDPRGLVHRLLNFYWKSWVFAEFLGGFEGWLVLRIDGHKMFLVNPATSAAPISLPPKTRQGDWVIEKVVLSSPPTDDKCSIVLKGRFGNLWFCRVGDSTWTQLYFAAKDIMFYKEQFYAVCWTGELQVFYSGLYSSPTILAHIPDCTTLTMCLMTSFDKLLVVMVGLIAKVIEVQSSNSSCTELESIGDNILLCSALCSLSLTCEEFPGLSPNHVYARYFAKNEELYSFFIGRKSYRCRVTRNRSPVFFTLFPFTENILFQATEIGQ